MKAEKIKPTLHVNGNIIAERMELDLTNRGGYNMLCINAMRRFIGSNSHRGRLACAFARGFRAGNYLLRGICLLVAIAVGGGFAMGVSNDIITAGVQLKADVARILGESNASVGYLCSNRHGKTNRYAWIKPVNEPQPFGVTQGNALMYVKHLRLRSYMVTSPTIPSNTLAEYDVPTGGAASPYRLADFIGYSHNEYPHTINLSALTGTTIDVDSVTGSFPITFRHDSGKALMSYLINRESIMTTGGASNLERWEFGILLIAKKEGDTRYYLIGSAGWWDTDLDINKMAYRKEMFFDMISVDITQYTCTLFGVAYLTSNQLYKDLGNYKTMPLKKSYQLALLPETPTLKPMATNVKLTKPKDRVYLRVVVIDQSDGDQYILEEPFIISAYSTGFDLNEENIYPNELKNPSPIGGFNYAGWILADSMILLEDNNPKNITLGMRIPNDFGNLEYQSNATNSIDDAFDVELTWNVDLQKHRNKDLDLFVYVRYYNRNYRP